MPYRQASAHALADSLGNPTAHERPGLTKAEKFQIVNLIPAEPIELCRECRVMRSSVSLPEFVRLVAFPVPSQVIEELGYRLGDYTENILGVMWSSLTAP